jgi:oligosaccharide repeat unit polymerase
MAEPLDRRAPEARPAIVAAIVVAASVAAGAALAAGVHPAWVLLGVCAVAAVPVVVLGLIDGRFLEPLPVIAAALVLILLTRPLQLMLEWQDLYSFFPPRDPLNSLLLLEGQEMANFVGKRLTEPLENAITRALGACALFIVLLLAGYALAVRRSLGRRLATLRGRVAPINLQAAIGGSLLVGLGAQTAVIARAGGPAASLESASKQTALSDTFVLFLLSGFSFVALVIWAAWARPRSRREWAAFAASVIAVVGLSLLAGSRARVVVPLTALAVVIHFTWRRWRLRELALGLLLLLAFGSSFAAFRQVSDRGVGDAVSAAGDHLLDPRLLLNDTTYFDHVVYATTIYGRERPHRHGQFLLDGVRSYVPRAIDPGKPPGGDIAFRRVVWGSDYGAGRPPTAVGDLYIDFGFPGVAVGALLIGVAAAVLLNLLRGAGPGREYRVALYAILLIVVYELVLGTFSIALGFAITLLIPFLIAIHGFGRLPRMGSADA